VAHDGRLSLLNPFIYSLLHLIFNTLSSNGSTTFNSLSIIPLEVVLDKNDSFDFILFFVWRHLVLLNGCIAKILNYVATTTFYISILGKPVVKELEQ